MTNATEDGVDVPGHILAKKPPRNRYALACSLLASLASILLGYDIGVMSGAVIYIKQDLKITDVQVEILAGILHVFSLIGSAAAGRTSDWIGRRYTLVVASVIFFAGAILMGFATNYAFLMAGRFVAGVGVGYALMIAPVYTAEVSPASSRGKLTSFPEVFINVGILLGYVSNVAFSKLPLHLTWRLMLGVGAIPSIFLGFSVLAMPESPRWLVLQQRLGEAQSVLNRTSNSLEEGEQRLADIKEAAGIPEHLKDYVVPVTKRRKGSGGEGVWRELFVSPTPAVRHILLVGVGIHFFQQATGIETVVLYSPRIFEKAGIKSDHDKLLCTVAVGSIKTLFILIATFTLDRFGRRKMLLTSIVGMTASMVLLGIGLTVVEHKDHKVTWALALSITMVLSYVSFFSMGMGPITWVYSSEIFPLRLRATGCSIGVAVNRMMSAATSMTFLSLCKAATIGGAFFLYSTVALLSVRFFDALMPETRGRTLEEMESLFGTFNQWEKTLKELNDNTAAAAAAKKANPPPQQLQTSSSNGEQRQSG